MRPSRLAEREIRALEENEVASSRFDALDRKLITALQSDPRLPYATLGSRLGVTGMTAANRLQRLRQAELVDIRVSPNFEACGLETDILGLLSGDTGVLAGCVDLLASSPYVLRIDRVTGEYDISFHAVFPSGGSMGTLVRDLQAVPGVRRLVVHHRLETVKDDDGWSAVWSEPVTREEATHEIAPGVRFPERLRERVMLAVRWLTALEKGDVQSLRASSTAGVVYTILEPQLGAGTFRGLPEVEEESKVPARAYRHIWHRLIGVSESKAPYDLVIDAVHTAERTSGQVRTAFGRLAFGFAGDRVDRVLSLGQLELPDVPDEATAGD